MMCDTISLARHHITRFALVLVCGRSINVWAAGNGIDTVKSVHAPAGDWTQLIMDNQKLIGALALMGALVLSFRFYARIHAAKKLIVTPEAPKIKETSGPQPAVEAPLAASEPLQNKKDEETPPEVKPSREIINYAQSIVEAGDPPQIQDDQSKKDLWQKKKAFWQADRHLRQAMMKAAPHMYRQMDAPPQTAPRPPRIVATDTPQK